MTRQFFVRLLLSLLLLISQQMALSHVVTHWAGARDSVAQRARDGKDGAPSKSLAQDPVCEQCLAFAQLANAIGNLPRTFAALDLGASSVVPGVAHGAAVRPLRAFEPRGPPLA
jgi:hypothetical protein